MGESRHNPRSEAYRGPLPENVLVPQIEAGTVIDPEWLKANAPVLGREMPPVPDEAIILEFWLTATWVRPSQIVPQQKWPQQKVGLTPLFRCTMAEFKALAADQKASAEGAQQATPA